MPDQQKNKQLLNDDLSSQLRRSVNDAYAFVRGQEVVESFSCITFEDLAAQQIERLSGKQTTSRPNEINRITRVYERVHGAVENIKALPADAFRKPDDTTDVNTKP